MSGVSWIDSAIPTDQPCIVCGNRLGNAVILTASHWHSGYDQLEVARCSQCQSAFTLNANEVIVPYPSAETVLQDPNFIYLIHHYLELVSGLDWKLPLLERLPFSRFKSVLEIGCNVGATLDYCRTAWGVDVLGLEPSAYGVKGGELLNLPIVNAYTHDAEALRNRKFSFIYATEVLEHVSDPLAFLKELRTYLEPDGILLITTPCSSALHKDTLPGELYAVLSPGSHYFLLSQKQLKRLAKQAGFKHADVKLLYQTNIAYLSDRSIEFDADPVVDSRLAHYHARKIAERANLDNRVYLGHLINYYTSAVNSEIPFDNPSITKQIEDQLSRQFEITLDTPLDLAQRVIQTESIFDFGQTVPYSLPSYLYKRAEFLNSVGATTEHCYELAAIIAAKGLQIDFKNLFLYNQILRLSLQQIDTLHNSSPETNPVSRQLRNMTESITTTIPQLNQAPLSLLARFKRKVRTLRNRWRPS
ncbi:MAG: class I SAM-dependent methyltransferase [Candidatus Thiodiazotropha sp.]